MLKATTVTHALALAGVLIVGLGTSCATLRRAQQPLRPYPSLTCLREALQTSPDVVEVTREFHGEQGSEGFHVVLRDSTAEDGWRIANLFRQSFEPTDRLELSVTWPGFKQPPPVEDQAFRAIAARVLNHLQTSCAPDEPVRPLCDSGDGRWEPCAPAG